MNMMDTIKGSLMEDFFPNHRCISGFPDACVFRAILYFNFSMDRIHPFACYYYVACHLSHHSYIAYIYMEQSRSDNQYFQRDRCFLCPMEMRK